MRTWLNFFHSTKTSIGKPSSDFSHFFREASSGEKKKIYLEVARKASEEQKKVFSQPKRFEVKTG